MPADARRSSVLDSPCRHRVGPARLSRRCRLAVTGIGRLPTPWQLPLLHVPGRASNGSVRDARDHRTEDGFSSKIHRENGLRHGQRARTDSFFPPPPAQRCARTTVPSMHHNCLSRFPDAIMFDCKRRWILSNSPSEFQVLNKQYTVSQGANSSSGKSRHGDPVRRTHKMASTTNRRLVRGRPVRAGGGNKSAINSHC